MRQFGNTFGLIGLERPIFVGPEWNQSSASAVPVRGFVGAAAARALMPTAVKPGEMSLNPDDQAGGTAVGPPLAAKSMLRGPEKAYPVDSG